MTDSNPTNRINITLPAALEELWRGQAMQEGLSLSEWVRQCCNANLSQDRQKKAPEARPPGRPSINRP